MANGSSRVLPVILSLAVGFAAGWLAGRSLAPKPKPRVGNHTIVVGPKAKDLSDDPAPMSQSKNHRARWFPQDQNQTLTITFKKGDFDSTAGGEPPFAGPKNTDLVITCGPGSSGKVIVCDPGPINTNLPILTDDQKLSYKYWQTLDGPNGYHDEADGWIIIKP